MSGEERYRELPCLIHRDNGGIGELVPHIGSNGPDRNAAGTDEEDSLAVGKAFSRPRAQILVSRDRQIQPCGNRYHAAVSQSRQFLRQRLGQCRSPRGKGGERQSHDSFPTR